MEGRQQRIELFNRLNEFQKFTVLYTHSFYLDQEEFFDINPGGEIKIDVYVSIECKPHVVNYKNTGEYVLFYLVKTEILLDETINCFNKRLEHKGYPPVKITDDDGFINTVTASFKEFDRGLFIQGKVIDESRTNFSECYGVLTDDDFVETMEEIVNKTSRLVSLGPNDIDDTRVMYV